MEDKKIKTKVLIPKFNNALDIIVLLLTYPGFCRS